MLAVAMALMAKPRLMTLDEPSLGLAPRVAQRVYSELALLRSEGTSMLIVEQSVDRVLSIADRGYILKLGRLAGEGTAAELRHDPMLRAAYLGRPGKTVGINYKAVSGMSFLGGDRLMPKLRHYFVAEPLERCERQVVVKTSKVEPAHVVVDSGFLLQSLNRIHYSA
jgi:energy-coupling factor transporter ATP-binding protein EcfA2